MSAPSNVERLEYQRKLDDSGKYDSTFIISGPDCCDKLARIWPLAHAIEVRRSGKQVWYGWIDDTDEGKRDYHMTAFDAIGWLKRRKIRTDLTWNNVDLTQQFIDVWNEITRLDPIRAQIVSGPTGVRETRSVKASENRMAWSVVKEMLDSGLDITAFGQTILAGVIATTKPMEFKLSDFEADNVRLSKLGSEFANFITIDASEQIQATYPPTPAGSNDFFPLVDVVIKDAQVQDQATAENMAKSRYEYARNIPIVLTNTDALILQPNVDVDINDLIPGIRASLDTEGLCTQIKKEFRLGEVNIVVESGSEKIGLSLEPTGPRDYLNDSADPVL